MKKLCKYVTIKKIKDGRRFLVVSIDTEEEIREIMLEKELVNDLANATKRDEEEIAKLLAVIEFIRKDSAKIEGRRVKNMKQFINRAEFKESLKSLVEFKRIDSIIEEISEMKYHEMKEFFFN